MTTTVDQKTYLQKYLGGPSGDKKKKKKKVTKGKGFKIIDDDLDLTKLRPLEGDELDIMGEGEDAPQIAGIIDERPEEVKKLEQFKTSSKWRVINEDDGFNSKLQIQEIKQDIKEAEKENEVIFGKMYSDSEEEKKNDSDLSPPRNESRVTETSKKSSKKDQSNSELDCSPPRRHRGSSPNMSKKKNYGSELSPPRKIESKKSKHRVRKPSRWGDFDKTETKSKRSPNLESPRRSKKHRMSQSPIRHSQKTVNSDMSPTRKSQKLKRKSIDSDTSPPRKSRKDSPKKRTLSPDSDVSPPRKLKSSHGKQSRNDMQNNKFRTDSKSSKTHLEKGHKSRKSPDSDLSPPRKNKRQKSPDPQNKSGKQSTERSHSKRNDSDSDLSPPRKQRERKEERYDSKREGRHKRSSDSPPPSNKKMAKTLDGKVAGLQDAVQLRQENESFRRREDEAFSRMGDEFSGRNAKVVSRKAKRETSEERRTLKEKAERQKELDEKYKKWSKGLKQIEDQEAHAQDFLHEASKPLARHRDDRDLEERLKDVERDGDPMLQYIRSKKRERGELGPEKPSYKGSFPPNRFNIRPGYRWDGVDRSNGYEKKYFEQQSKRKAQEEEAYKWSTEDL